MHTNILWGDKHSVWGGQTSWRGTKSLKGGKTNSRQHFWPHVRRKAPSMLNGKRMSRPACACTLGSSFNFLFTFIIGISPFAYAILMTGLLEHSFILCVGRQTLLTDSLTEGKAELLWKFLNKSMIRSQQKDYNFSHVCIQGFDTFTISLIKLPPVVLMNEWFMALCCTRWSCK